MDVSDVVLMWFLLKFTGKQQAQYILQVMQDIKRYKSPNFCLLKWSH